MPSVASPALFSPLRVGDVNLEHRIVLAPLTRMKANAEHVPQDVAAEYYGQRATAGGLLISEATYVAAKAGGMANVPGIWNDAQIEGWRKIVDAVHAKGGKISLQLWHLGRAAIEEGFDAVAPSAISFEGGAPSPRPMTLEEIVEAPKLYAQAAINFIRKAGGDLVEVHSANGYLPNAFLDPGSNKRTDNYGGSVENRARFGLEVIAEVVKAVGADKVGVRLSPFSEWQDMKGFASHSDLVEQYSYYAREIKKLDLAYLHAVEGRVAGILDQTAREEESLDFLHDIWAPKPFIVAGGYTRSSALDATSARENVAVAVGRYFISNPDLVQRFKENLPLTPYDRKLFYVPGPEHKHGYVDYPTYQQEQKEHLVDGKTAPKPTEQQP